jgi:hypothetical protein
MKHTLLSLLMIFVPLTVFAQEAGAPSANMPQLPSLVGDDQDAPDGLESTVDERQLSPAQPPPAPAARRRRGSMVGYIDDAVIGSKMRVRFDIGLKDTVPDRAEFFYAKCGCYGGDAPGPQPGSANDLDFQQLAVWGEYAVNDRFSAFGQVPVRWIQPQAFILTSLDGQAGFPNQAGFGDLRAGVKLGVVASPDQSVTVQAQFYFPTGEASKGLGTHHASIEPALLYYQRLSDVVVLESQLGVWLPLGGSSGVAPNTDRDFSGNVFYYGIGPSFEIYKADRVQFAPVIELVGWRVVSGLQTLPPDPESEFKVKTVPADGTNIVNLKIGARISMDRGSFYVGYGHALTDATWYDSIVRLEYRYSF